MSFKRGDRVVIKSLNNRKGIITEIFPEIGKASVSLGHVTMFFPLEELSVYSGVATMEIFKSVHNTIDVVVQNCSEHVNDFLSLFDVWESHGNYKYDGLESWERAKIWFECPMEFLDFIKSPIGERALHRLGIEKIEVENDETIL